MYLGTIIMPGAVGRLFSIALGQKHVVFLSPLCGVLILTLFCVSNLSLFLEIPSKRLIENRYFLTIRRPKTWSYKSWAI